MFTILAGEKQKLRKNKERNALKTKGNTQKNEI
jgi:hypothetical protein